MAGGVEQFPDGGEGVAAVEQPADQPQPVQVGLLVEPDPALPTRGRQQPAVLVHPDVADRDAGPLGQFEHPPLGAAAHGRVASGVATRVAERVGVVAGHCDRARTSAAPPAPTGIVASGPAARTSRSTAGICLELIFEVTLGSSPRMPCSSRSQAWP